MRKAFLALLWLLAFLPKGAIALEQESLPEVIGTLSGLAVGVYTGITPHAGEISPWENSEEGVGELTLSHLGVVAKYKFSFLFFRTGVDGALTLLGGKGKINNSEFLFQIQQVEIPFVGGFQFPLTRNSSLYMGLGGSYALGVLEVKNHLVQKNYPFRSVAVLYLLGAEYAITENGFFLFEWQRLAGSTPVLGNDEFSERELSLNNQHFLIGYQYYFRF